MVVEESDGLRYDGCDVSRFKFHALRFMISYLEGVVVPIDML